MYYFIYAYKKIKFLLQKKLDVPYLNKILKYYPLALILQLPLILGFVLPISFYNNFYYLEIEIENNFVSIAKKNYLIMLFVINLFIFFLIYLTPVRNHIHKKHLFSSFLITSMSIFSVISTVLSKLFVFEIYYLNLFFYIGQNIVLILFLLHTTFNFQKKELIVIFFSIVFCNIIALYTGDSKFFLVTTFTFFIVGYFKYSLKKNLLIILILSILIVLILGSKKIYRDYVHFGGMDKLNYKYNEKNVTYTNKFDYRNTEDFFIKQKLQFAVYSKSFLYSNICGNGEMYKNNRNIEKLIHDLVFEDGKFKKEKIQLSNIILSKDDRKFIFSKTQNHCYIFFTFINRVDFLTPLAQSIKEVNTTNYLKGATYKPIIYSLIPRFIYKNKPTDNADELYMGLMKKLKDPNDKNRTIISVSIITEAWINFLKKGIFLIGVTLGFLITIISIFYQSNSFFLKVLSSTLIIHILNLNLSLKQIISGSYQSFVIFIFIYYLNNIFLKYLKKYR